MYRLGVNFILIVCFKYCICDDSSEMLAANERKAKVICSNEGEWSQWDEWSLCHENSGKKVQVRSRSCRTLPEGCIMGAGYMCNETSHSHIAERLCNGTGITDLLNSGSTKPFETSSTGGLFERNTSETGRSSTSDIHTTTIYPLTTTTANSGESTLSLPCEPKGVWSEWHAWSVCVRSDEGTQSRNKTCDGVPRGCQVKEKPSCEGKDSETHVCGTAKSTTPETDFGSTTGFQSTFKFGPKSTTESALSFESTLTPHLPLTTTTVSSLTSSTAFPETTTTTTVIASSTTPPLKCAKMWSPWTKWGPCTEKCGGCGEKIRFQKCKKLDLPVEGCVCPSTNFKEEKAKCAFKACPPPASPCCNGHLPSGFDSNGMAICGVGSVPENVFEEFENME